MEADAVRLPRAQDGTFDVITCAAGLLYMPVADALREWHRLLKPGGGRIAFSTMCAGSPPAGRIFRDCAAAFGATLRDPSEPLGSPAACRNALEAAGFDVTAIVSDTIAFTSQDLSLAWESNLRSAGHEAVRLLGDEQRRALEERYRAALDREQSEHPGTLARAGLLYAVGRR